jgi:hypothetical protein
VHVQRSAQRQTLGARGVGQGLSDDKSHRLGKCEFGKVGYTVLWRDFSGVIGLTKSKFLGHWETRKLPVVTGRSGSETGNWPHRESALFDRFVPELFDVKGILDQLRLACSSSSVRFSSSNFPPASASFPAAVSC